MQTERILPEFTSLGEFLKIKVRWDDERIFSKKLLNKKKTIEKGNLE